MPGDRAGLAGAEWGRVALADGTVLGAGVGDDSLDEIFKEFKKGVDAQLDTEDYETHYNLCIAYREMSLLDEAIAELQLDSKDESKFIDS